MILQIERYKVKGEPYEWWVHKGGKRIGVSSRTKAEAISAARVWGDEMEIPVQPCEVPGMVRQAAKTLKECGVALDYYGGTGKFGEIGRILISDTDVLDRLSLRLEGKG